MQSSPDRNQAGIRITGFRLGEAFRLLNNKLHYFLGLYLLFFVWLFALTGLLLNHSQWKFAEFWESRGQSSFDRELAAPVVEGDLAQAHNIMEQLGIRGEVEWTVTRNNPGRFDFRVSRPGHIFDIKADLVDRKASVQRIDLNAWGVMRILHTFTGVRADDARNTRDWVLTSVWALAMDAVAVGLILVVLSGLYLWYGLRQHRLSGAIVLALGVMLGGLFCFGLSWVY